VGSLSAHCLLRTKPSSSYRMNNLVRSEQSFLSHPALPVQFLAIPNRTESMLIEPIVPAQVIRTDEEAISVADEVAKIIRKAPLIEIRSGCFRKSKLSC